MLHDNNKRADKGEPMRARKLEKNSRTIVKELIAFRGGGGLGIGGRAGRRGSERSFKVGQTDQVRGIWNFVNT